MKDDDFMVRVPATNANLGPGFDCLGITLDLWNETRFHFNGNGFDIQINGYGADSLPKDEMNLIVQSFNYFMRMHDAPVPGGMHLVCNNDIPLESGLGSSSAAILTGLMAANQYLGGIDNDEEILHIAARLEGHADNVSAAIMGGLVVCIEEDEKPFTQRFEAAEWDLAYVIPHIVLSTKVSREVLPGNVPMQDAVFNLGRTVLVVEALRSGNPELLTRSMKDKLHQPYRLKLIPGSEDAIRAALDQGAVSAGLSGAGPGLLAFTRENSDIILASMVKELSRKGIESTAFVLRTTSKKAKVSFMDDKRS